MRQIKWVGSSLRDLKSMPRGVQRDIGHALNVVEMGGRPDNSKVLKGFGSACVSEIIKDDRSGTYRAVYTVEVQHQIFVLHVFQKKSTRGIETSRRDVELIRKRLKEVRDYLKA